MPKFNAGLHKDVSAIFDGVVIHRDAAESGILQKPAGTAPAVPTPQPGKPLYSTNRAGAVQQRQSLQRLSKIKDKFSTLFSPDVAPRQKMMTVLIPILLIVFVWVLIRVFNTNPTGTIKAGTFQPEFTPVASVEKNTWKAPEPYPTDIRNPMEFGSEATTSSKTEYNRVIVKGIVYSVSKPTAIIGNEIVCAGDKVSGVTIVKINADSVEFEMNGERWTQKVQD